MDSSMVNSIELTTNNKDIITITKDSFKNFFIGNINDDGDKYSSPLFVNNNANCFIIKMINDNSKDSEMIINRLLSKKDIISVNITLTNNKSIHYELAKKRILQNGLLENKYNCIFKDTNNDLCILITNKKLKYIEGLFI